MLPFVYIKFILGHIYTGIRHKNLLIHTLSSGCVIKLHKRGVKSIEWVICDQLCGVGILIIECVISCFYGFLNDPSHPFMETYGYLINYFRLIAIKVSIQIKEWFQFLLVALPK